MRATTLVVAVGVAILTAGCASSPVDRKNDQLNQGVAKYNAGDCAGAFKVWFPLAQEGMPYALNNVGMVFKAGCPAANIRKDYATALSYFSMAAKQGSIYAYHNIGTLYEDGLGVQRDRDKAIAQYTYSARWGTPKSADALRRLGAPVPEADLLAAEQARKKEQIAAAEARKREEAAAATSAGMELLGAILLGVAEGMNDAYSQPYPTYSSPSYSGSGYQPPKASTPPATKVYAPPGCSSDYDCGPGKKCAKPLYQSTGTCLKVVNEYGTPQFGINPSPQSSGIRAAPSCNFSTDCPIGFRCDDSLKLCVK